MCEPLSAVHLAALAEWRARILQSAFRTGEADKPRFAAAVAKMYHLAGLPGGDNVVWVDSPLILAMVGPLADFVIRLHGKSGYEERAAALEAMRVASAWGENHAWTAIERALDQPLSQRWNSLNPWHFFQRPDGLMSELNLAVGNAEGAVRAAVKQDLHHPQALQDHQPAVTHAALQVLQKVLTIDKADIQQELEVVLRCWPLLDLMRNRWENVRDGDSQFSSSYLDERARTDGLLNQWPMSNKEALLVENHVAACESAGWWWAHRDFILACPPPLHIHQELAQLVITIDGPHDTRDAEVPRLHCEDSPAMAWADGWGIHSIHGVIIPSHQSHIVQEPQFITVSEIDAERNAEIRRIMINRYGPERYLKDSSPEIVDKLPDNHPITGLRGASLLRKEAPDDEPVIYVELLNSTPELDGSVKHYMLRVDPSAYKGQAARSAHAAAASTWRNADGSMVYANWRDYRPAFES